jgi:lysophospholipase L1-like esterase
MAVTEHFERRISMRRSHWTPGIILACGVAALSCAYGAAAASATPAKAVLAAPDGCTPGWVATWAASPSSASLGLDPTLNGEPTALKGQSLRMIITPHASGSLLRLHLSNRFGTAPLTLDHVTVAEQVTGTQTTTPVTVTFGGSSSVTIPAGADAVSDPVSLLVTAFHPLAVSIFAQNAATITQHWDANATSYYANASTGDQTTSAAGQDFSNSMTSWYFVDEADVRSTARSVVAFGDSITDGWVAATPLSIPITSSILNTNARYPDDLQRRLTAAGVSLTAVNAGISSNQLLASGSGLTAVSGPSGLSRFNVDALRVAGVSGIIVLEGINDLGLGSGVTPAQLEAGYTQLINEAHAAGVKIWLGTITPAANSIIDGTLTAPTSEAYRQQVNAWIRTQTLADGVIDFDAAIRNPQDPSQILPSLAGPDNLHPNLAGYQAMANAVNLSQLQGLACGS